jgi:CheY-like chemotaxis protein
MKAARLTRTAHDDRWPPTRLRGVRVLVVDDDPDERDYLVALLGAAAAEVRSASSTSEALAMLAWWWPSVLVSDIGMPGEDGYTLIRAIRTMPRGQPAQLPAAAVTGRSAPDDRTRALRAGYQAHLAKPVDPDRLIAVLADLARLDTGGQPSPSP